MNSWDSTCNRPDTLEPPLCFIDMVNLQSLLGRIDPVHPANFHLLRSPSNIEGRCVATQCTSLANVRGMTYGSYYATLLSTWPRS